MNNVDWSIEGDILTIRIDLTQDFGPSSSGKTRIITRSVGADREEQIGVSVYRPQKAHETGTKKSGER